MSKEEINWYEVAQRRQERIDELERQLERSGFYAEALKDGFFEKIDAKIEQLQKERDYWRHMAQKGSLGMEYIFLMWQMASLEVVINTVVTHEGGMAALQKELTPVLADLERLKPEHDRVIDELIELSGPGGDNTLQSARNNLARQTDSYYQIARTLVEVTSKAEFPKLRKKAIENIAELHSEEYRKHTQDVWKLASGGAPRKAEIDHLCDLARPLQEQGLTWKEVTKQIDKWMEGNLEDISYKLWWDDWDGHQEQNLTRECNRRAIDNQT